MEQNHEEGYISTELLDLLKYENHNVYKNFRLWDSDRGKFFSERMCRTLEPEEQESQIMFLQKDLTDTKLTPRTNLINLENTTIKAEQENALQKDIKKVFDEKGSIYSQMISFRAKYSSREWKGRQINPEEIPWLTYLAAWMIDWGVTESIHEFGGQIISEYKRKTIILYWCETIPIAIVLHLREGKTLKNGKKKIYPPHAHIIYGLIPRGNEEEE